MAKTGTPQPKATPISPPKIVESLEDEDIFDAPTEKLEINPPEAQFISAKKLQDEQKLKIEARKLPPFPKRLTFGELIDLRNKMSEEQKEHLIAYVYRLEPVIDRRLKDPASVTNIDVLATDGQFNHDYFTKTHGGGRYNIIVNDTDHRKNGMVCEFIHEIDRNQHDPILDLEELDVWAKKNEPYVLGLMAKGRLDNSRKVIKNPTANANQGQVMQNDVTSKLLDTVLQQLRQTKEQNSNDPVALTMATKFMDTLSDRLKADSPQGQVSLLSGIMAMLQPMLIPKQDNALQYLTLMETMRDNNAKQMDAMRQSYESKLDSLQTKLLELLNKPQEKPDVAGEIEKIKGLAEVMGLASGGKMSTLETILDKLAEPLSAAITTFGPMLAQKFSSPALPQQTPNPGMPRMLPDSMPPQPPNPNIPNNVEKENMELTIPATPDFLDQLIDQHGMMLVGYIGNNKNGADVADSLFEAGLMDLPAYTLVTKDGTEGIISKMRSKPQFWANVSRFGETRVIKFVKEFVEWGMEETDEVEEKEIVQ